MNKESKYYITIEESDMSFFKVELEDHYGSRTTIYERTIDEAVTYARNWCKQAEDRYKADQIHAKAIAECIKLDREAGITSRYRDCLD
jgi:hypothetical protein